MRKWLGLILLSWALSACEKPQFSRIPRYLLQQDRFARYAVFPEPEHEPALWITGIQYPDSVSWRDHPDAPGARVFLLKDGEEVLSVPAGLQVRPERHRFQAGHLWTDTSDGQETIVYCDGVEQFRFPGDELLLGFLAVDGQVHTLGQRQGQDGICYRIDGVEVFSSDQGTAVGSLSERAWPGGALMADESGVYYVYRVPVRTYQKLDWEYRVMRGADPVDVILAGTAETIYDVRVFQGQVYSLQRRGLDSLVMVAGNTPQFIPQFMVERVCSCRLYPLDGALVLKGYSSLDAAGVYLAWLRNERGIMHNAVSERLFLEWQPEGTTLAAIDLQDGLVGSIWREGKELEGLSEPYTMASPLCMLCQDGLLAIGLTHAETQDHLLLVNDVPFPISFNGYFCSLYFE